MAKSSSGLGPVYSLEGKTVAGLNSPEIVTCRRLLC